MNKNTTVIIILALVVILGAGFFVWNSQNAKKSAGLNVSNQVSKNAVDGETFTGNLDELMKLGKNYVCEISYSDEQGFSTRGVVYAASDKRVRADFENESPDGTSKTMGLINDGEYSYMWSSDVEQGMKVKNEENGELEAPEIEDSEDSVASYLEDDVDYDYKCKLWIVDESVFKTPEDVQFIDLSQSLEGLQESMLREDSNNTDDPCAACDMMPDEATKAQCLSSLNCN